MNILQDGAIAPHPHAGRRVRQFLDTWTIVERSPASPIGVVANAATDEAGPIDMLLFEGQEPVGTPLRRVEVSAAALESPSAGARAAAEMDLAPTTPEQLGLEVGKAYSAWWATKDWRPGVGDPRKLRASFGVSVVASQPEAPPEGEVIGSAVFPGPASPGDIKDTIKALVDRL